MSESTPMFSSDEILVGLRDKDAAVRRVALDAVFPEGNALLIQTLPQGTASCSTTKADPRHLFCALLFLAQRVGDQLGLSLAWTEDPGKAKGLLVPKKGIELVR